MTMTAEVRSSQQKSISRKRQTSPASKQASVGTRSVDRIPELLAMEQLSLSGMDADAMIVSHNNSWRERIAQWSYDMIDQMKAPRDVVYTNITILDRYVATQSRSMAQSEYRAAAIASLFIAMRLGGAPKRLTMQRLLRISKPGVSNRDALATVSKILKTLTFDHPMPSPSAFVRAFLAPFRERLGESQVSGLSDHALYLAELSVCDTQLGGVAPSKIGFAALILSLNPSTGACPKTLDPTVSSCLLEALCTKTGMDCSSTEIKSVCSLLQSSYDESYDNDIRSAGSSTTTAVLIEASD